MKKLLLIGGGLAVIAAVVALETAFRTLDKYELSPSWYLPSQHV